MRRVIFILLTALSLTSCEYLSSIIHDDTLVAKVGKNKLYSSNLAGYIPDHVSEEDSLNLVMRYINTWATEILYLEMAQEQLSKDEKDVTDDLEKYRRTLLKYRYEQRYVNDRLDTMVTQAQIDDYFKAHQEFFILERPVVRYRYLAIPKNCDRKDRLLRLLASSDSDELEELDSLASVVALKYEDRSEQWSDMSVLAKEAGIPYEDVLPSLKGSFLVVSEPSSLEEKIAFICEIKTSGVAPEDYCTPKIVSMIQSGRKHKLLLSLEQDLLRDALEHKKLVIY